MATPNITFNKNSLVLSSVYCQDGLGLFLSFPVRLGLMCEVLLPHGPASLHLLLLLLLLRGAAGVAHDDVFLLRFGDVLGLQQVELDEGVDDQQSCSKNPPEGNVAGQRFGHRLLPELDADDELGHDDGDQDPCLTAQLVALRIVQELESLPQT